MTTPNVVYKIALRTLQLYDGQYNYTDDNLLWAYCGELGERVEFLAPSTVVTILFVTNADNAGRGFNILYETGAWMKFQRSFRNRCVG